MAFGEEISSEIFKNLSELEIKRIGTAMSGLGRLEEDVVDEVILEFYEILQQNKQFFYGGNEYTRKVIGSAFKEGRAQDLINQLSLNSANLDSLELIAPRTLASLICNEHPQTIALILAHLDPGKMGKTLKLLPDNLHTEVLQRIANLDSVAPELIKEIEAVLRQELQSMGSLSTDKLGGSAAIAHMLNTIDKTSEEEILSNLDETDPELAEEIRQLMFVFDDLIKLDDRSIQELIKRVPNDKWKVALKTSSESVREHIFKNMSPRAAEILREDMEIMSAIKLSEVESIQNEILQITRQLEQEGQVIIVGNDSSYV